MRETGKIRKGVTIDFIAHKQLDTSVMDRKEVRRTFGQNREDNKRKLLEED